MANLATTISKLDSSWKTLRQRWEATKVVWNDPVRWEFEQTYWEPLERQMQATQREMERLSKTIAQARRSVK